MYYDFEEKIKFIKPHRVLSLQIGEKEGILSVGLFDEDYIISFLEKKIIKKNTESASIVKSLLKIVIKDLLFLVFRKRY